MTRLQLWEPGELFDYEFPHEQFICDPLLPSSGILLVHGPTNVGKTRLGFTLALAIARGEPFLSHFQAQRGKVLYIQADMPNSLYQDRVQSVPAFAEAGVPIWHLTTDGDVFDVLNEAKRPSELIEGVRELEPSVVMVDTLSKCHWLDENDGGAPKAVYGAFRALFPGSAFVFYGHDRKVAQVGWQTSRAQDESAKGGTGWRDNADAVIHMLPQGAEKDDTDIRVKLKFTKVRGAAIPDPLTVIGNPKTLLLQAASIGDVQIAHWLALGMSRAAIVEELTQFGVSRTSAYRRLEQEDFDG